MKGYPKYKDSGVEWLGEIPEHWSNERFKFNCTLINEKSDYDAKPKIGLENIESHKGKYTETNSDFAGGGIRFQKQDILFGKLRPYLNKVYLSEFDGSAVGDIFVYRAKENIFPRFLFYRLFSHTYINVIDGSTYGAKMPRASSEFIGDLPFTHPDYTEQKAIATFLDQKTSKIDSLIEKKKQMIELLKEERAAIINQAVTKGINPDVEMKDSGIEWLGEVPKHWEVKKLKYCLKEVIGGGTPSKNKPEYWKGNIPWVSPKDMKSERIDSSIDSISDRAVEESATSLVPQNAILIVVRSGILKHTLPVAFSGTTLTLNQDMKALIPEEKLSPDFLFFLFKGLMNELLTFTTKQGATVDSIEFEYLMNFEIAYPLKDEQDEIVKCLARKINELDKTIELANRECGLFEEYRTALINEAVTGKIDVREKVQA